MSHLTPTSTTSIPAAGSGQRLNPMASNSTPSEGASSKRKATSSLRSRQLGEHITQVQVHLDADQILGADVASSSPLDFDWSDFEDLDGDALFPPPNPPVAATIMTGPGGRFRSHPRKTADHKCQRPAVLLIQTSDSANPSFGHHEQESGRLPYLPLHPPITSEGNLDAGLYTILPSHAHRIQHAANGFNSHAETAIAWPAGRLPVEIFELITSHLARDDIKSLRLVNKEFESKVCQSLFRTAVVPFNTEIYDMIIDEKKTNDHDVDWRKSKGKGKMRMNFLDQYAEMTGQRYTNREQEAENWGWRNAKEDKEGKVYLGHGLRVFQGFGPAIRRFGMSFEVVESQLCNPPRKHLLDPVESYHGTYHWPSIDYARFANLNRLEQTADETSRMKLAFSNLTIVTELGLSLRNGLGWLEGPDRSFRARLLPPVSTVFGTSRRSQDRMAKSARDVLSALRQCTQRAAPGTNFKEMILERRTLDTSLNRMAGLDGSCFADSRLWSTLEDELLESIPQTSRIAGRYTLLCANTELAGAGKLGGVDLNPSDLRKEQKEWLLETEWAQRAFLESYILAVMDNSDVSSRITTFNLACVSSGLLPLISRTMFWDALPSVSKVRILVSPDWRSVQKDEAGYADTKLQNPSEALRGFCELLHDHISGREYVKQLEIGWADGGEHAQGLYARNAHVLPAPVSSLEQSTSVNPTNRLGFPHVEHLTLTNCWTTPVMLERLVKSHAGLALKKLTLDSVSLTAHPHAPTPGQQAQAAALAQINAMQGPGFHQQFFLSFQQQMPQMPQQMAPPINMGHAQPAFGGPPVLPMNPLWNAPGAAANVPQHFGLPAPNTVNAQHQQWQSPNAAQWAHGHRQGSWPDILNKISPGPIFVDYLPQPRPWEDQRPSRPSTSLQTIELKSCGYISLDHNTSFDQSTLLAEVGAGRDRALSPWFRARFVALKQYMLDDSNDKYLGNIAQWIPHRELDAMQYAWGLRVGWRDREKAEEAEFDGRHAGGTGRVSGVITRGMPLVNPRNHVPAKSWP